jgi:hypothetical protein
MLPHADCMLEVSLETTLTARVTDKVSWFNCDTIVAFLPRYIRNPPDHHVLHQPVQLSLEQFTE